MFVNGQIGEEVDIIRNSWTAQGKKAMDIPLDSTISLIGNERQIVDDII